MIFSEFCEMTQPKYFGYDSQAYYLRGLFNAAKIRRSYSDDHLKGLFNGKKNFSHVKKQFPRPLDKESVAHFFETRVKVEYLETVCSTFGIPADYEKNTTFPGIALLILMLVVVKDIMKACGKCRTHLETTAFLTVEVFLI